MSADAAPYAELAVASCFSFLRGASRPEELVETALMLGHAGMAVTDRNTLAGVVRPWTTLRDLKKYAATENNEALAARVAGFRYVVGARLAFADGAPDVLAYPLHREGYGRLSRLLSTGARRVKKGECHLELADLLNAGEGLALALVPPFQVDAAGLGEVLARLGDAHPGLVWLAGACGFGAADARRLDALAELAQARGAPLLAVNDVVYHAPERRPLHDVMTCIREHTTLDKAGRRLQANAERHLKPACEMARLFREHPGALDQTRLLLDLIDFDFGELKYEYPQEPIPPGTTPQQHLEDLTRRGAEWRYPDGVPKKVQDQLDAEFAFIARRDYARYFLTVHDVVRFARDKAILCQGRGSAANSAVCYCLGVTAVDPAVVDLLFARFISDARDEPPDIDVDFEHERREEVIQYLYGRYGRERAAICATVIHYRPRSAIREVGKALGLSEDITAALAGMVWGSWGGRPDPDHVRQAGLDPDNPEIARALSLASELIGFPRHLSQHVGGFVLTQHRLDETCPIVNAAMPDRTFIEWDKDDIDALDLMKVDVLALGMLSCIRRAFDLMRRHDIGDIADMAEIEGDDDPAVYAMLARGDSIGVFQVESRAQINMLPRLKPCKFYDLVIEVAIVRPGPIQGDMVHPYLRRKQGLETMVYEKPHPDHGDADELEKVLKRTLGVPLFQEQAMQMVITAARFTEAEADGLRRAMATFKRTGGMAHYRDKMIGGMTARGYSQDFAERCFRQIEGFGSYGFPESHAASFAKLVYVSAWLKHHHPAVFCAALLNAQPMGFYAPAQLVRDAREHGVAVRPPCVLHSDWDSTLESDGRGGLALRLGLRQIGGLPEAAAKAVVDARAGDFDAFVRGAGLSRPHLQLLAEADALAGLGFTRRAALWRVRGLAAAPPAPLLQGLAETEPAVSLPAMRPSEEVVVDYQTTRLSLKGHPVAFLREELRAAGVKACMDLARLRDGAPVRVAGVVLVRQRPGTGVVCFITIEDETGVANLVVMPKVFETYRRLIMSARLIEVRGRVQRAPGAAEVIHVLAERLIDHSDALSALSEPDDLADGNRTETYDSFRTGSGASRQPDGEYRQTSFDRARPVGTDRRFQPTPSAPAAQNRLHPPLARADHVVRNGPSGGVRPQVGSHPRNVRILPPSRDFH